MSQPPTTETTESAEIAGMAELHQYLKDHHHNATRFNDHLFRFEVERDGTLVAMGGHSVGMLAAETIEDERREADDPWIGLSVKICLKERLRVRPALVANLELPVGALALMREWVVVNQTLSLERLLASHFEQTVQALAALGLELRAAAEGGEHPYAYVFR